MEHFNLVQPHFCHQAIHHISTIPTKKITIHCHKNNYSNFTIQIPLKGGYVFDEDLLKYSDMIRHAIFG